MSWIDLTTLGGVITLSLAFLRVIERLIDALIAKRANGKRDDGKRNRIKTCPLDGDPEVAKTLQTINNHMQRSTELQGEHFAILRELQIDSRVRKQVC